MKFTLEIDLGNDAMRTSRNVRDALHEVGERFMAAIPHYVNRSDSGRIRDVNGNTVGSWIVDDDRSSTTPTGKNSASITQLEFDEQDFPLAERVARRLGFRQTAYTSTSALWGLFCLPDRPTQRAGCIIKTKQFGLMFVQDLEDLHMDEMLAGNDNPHKQEK